MSKKPSFFMKLHISDLYNDNIVAKAQKSNKKQQK